MIAERYSKGVDFSSALGVDLSQSGQYHRLPPPLQHQADHLLGEIRKGLAALGAADISGLIHAIEQGTDDTRLDTVSGYLQRFIRLASEGVILDSLELVQEQTINCGKRGVIQKVCTMPAGDVFVLTRTEYAGIDETTYAIKRIDTVAGKTKEVRTLKGSDSSFDVRLLGTSPDNEIVYYMQGFRYGAPPAVVFHNPYTGHLREKNMLQNRPYRQECMAYDPLRNELVLSRYGDNQQYVDILNVRDMEWTTVPLWQDMGSILGILPDGSLVASDVHGFVKIVNLYKRDNLQKFEAGPLAGAHVLPNGGIFAPDEHRLHAYYWLPPYTEPPKRFPFVVVSPNYSVSPVRGFAEGSPASLLVFDHGFSGRMRLLDMETLLETEELRIPESFKDAHPVCSAFTRDCRFVVGVGSDVYVFGERNKGEGTI